MAPFDVSFPLNHQIVYVWSEIQVHGGNWVERLEFFRFESESKLVAVVVDDLREDWRTTEEYRHLKKSCQIVLPFGWPAKLGGLQE